LMVRVFMAILLKVSWISLVSFVWRSLGYEQDACQLPPGRSPRAFFLWRTRCGGLEAGRGDRTAAGRRQHFAETCSASHNTGWLIEFATGADVRGCSAHDA